MTAHIKTQTRIIKTNIELFKKAELIVSKGKIVLSIGKISKLVIHRWRPLCGNLQEVSMVSYDTYY